MLWRMCMDVHVCVCVMRLAPHTETHFHSDARIHFCLFGNEIEEKTSPCFAFSILPINGLFLLLLDGVLSSRHIIIAAADTSAFLLNLMVVRQYPQCRSRADFRFFALVTWARTLR
jgi:hypothetical protein